MTEPTQVQPCYDWRQFAKKHWIAVTIFAVAAVLAVAGAVYVFVWFAGYAQTTGLVPSILSMWTMANIVYFILHAIFWELVFIGIPVAVGAVIGWLWWRRLPEQEKSCYKSGKRSRSRDGGGAVSTLLFIAFAIKVYVDGYWNVAVATYTVDYVVGSMVTILIWIAAILAIPAVIALVWWLTRGKTNL